MATTEPLTGNTLYQQTDAPLGGLQAGTVVSQMAPLVTPRFATAAARDTAFQSWVTAGNAMRDGLQCWVAGSGRQEYTTSAGWTTVSDGKQPGKRQRQWVFQRSSSNASDDFTQGSMTILVSGTATAAPAGDYLINGVLAMGAHGATAGNLRVTANGVNLSEDIRCDVDTTARPASFTTTFTHPGGDLPVSVAFQTATQIGTVRTDGSRVSLAYLGPS